MKGNTLTPALSQRARVIEQLPLLVGEGWVRAKFLLSPLVNDIIRV